MMETLKQLLSAEWLSSLLGVLGIFLAVIFYLRSRNRRRVAFLQTSELLIGDHGALPGSVEVRYNGKTVPQLWRSTFVIWNAGNMTIDGDAVVTSDPLRIHLHGDSIEVLSVEVERVTRSVIAFHAAIDAKENIALSFDFMDPGDGVFITILHSGGRSAILGTIKGLPKGLEHRGSVESEGYKKPAGTSDAVLMFAFVMWGGIAATLHFLFRLSKDNSAPWSAIAIGALLLVAIWKVMAAPRAPQSLWKRPGDG